MGLNKRLIDQAGGAAGVTNTDNFAPVTYTGTGSTQSISSLDFSPDLVWIKNRDYSPTYNLLFDSVRGATKWLSSNATLAEGTIASSLTSFDTNGFSLGADPSGANEGWNRNGNSHVAWCWKAGGTAVSNTDGTITSQVSANTAAGFSIVSYTGSASANQTVGHGLSQTPELIIVKNRDTAGNSWAVQSSAMGGADWHMLLNSTQAKQNNVDWIWNDTEPTSTVFTVGEFGLTNQSPDKFIAYCFHSVNGYQKIGSYTGNGTSNSITGVGFQPRFVLIKRTDSANGWNLFDSARGAGLVLFPHTSGAELDNTANFISFDSDGFSLASSGGDTNASGGTYIYLAIA